MPRAKSNRGGVRQGQPGKTYTNRSDLNTNRAQPIRTVPGQQYGTQTQQAAAQRQNPLPQAPPVPTGPGPGELPSLDAPSSRPMEPVTAGVPSGPGPGPEVLGFTPQDDAAMQIRALYQATGLPDFLDLLDALDEDG